MKSFQLVASGLAAEFEFESKLEPLLGVWPLLPKAVPEDNQRF